MPGWVTDKMALAITHSLGMAKLARDEHYLILYTDRAQQNHHTGVGIAGYCRGIEVIREAAGFNDSAKAYHAELWAISKALRAVARYTTTHPERHVIHLHIFSNNDSAVHTSLESAPKAGQQITK